MDCYEKFDTCKYSKGIYCYIGKGFIGKLLKLRHNVGVNNFSIKCHCENCKRYKPVDGGNKNEKTSNNNNS